MHPRSLLPLVALFWLAAVTVAPAQELTIGSPAPALDVEAWLKGEPIAAFAPGRIYLVEFWATWCVPCIAGMPQLTRLQTQLGDTVTVIGVNIWEEPPGKPYTDETRVRVARFVADNAAKLGYRVAYDGGAQRMAKAWMAAAGLNSIPNAFLIDRDGLVAHIGHPLSPEFRNAVTQVIAGNFDLAAARAAHERRRAAAVEDMATRQVAMQRMKETIAHALPLARAGDYAAAVAACDSLGDVGEVFGRHPRDEARIMVFKSLFVAPDPDIANAYVDHLLRAGGLEAPISYGSLAWAMVDPDHGAKGSDPARALRCSERALADTTGLAMARPLLLDTHALALAANGRLEEAIATQTEAVALEKHETMKAMMQERLDAYTARR